MWMNRPARPSTRRGAGGLAGATALAWIAALAPLPSTAADGAANPPAVAGQRVYTRAVVRDLPAAADQPALIRLKVVPRGKLPFSTLTFQLDDRQLLQGIAVGDEVGFIAERRPGGNTVTALRKVAPCVRFQSCPVITD